MFAGDVSVGLAVNRAGERSGSVLVPSGAVIVLSASVGVVGSIRAVLFGHRELLTSVSAIRVPHARSTATMRGPAQQCRTSWVTRRSLWRFVTVQVRNRKLYCD